MAAPTENKPATSQDLGRQSRAALRVAGRKTGENRWVRAFYSAGRVTASSVSRVMHVLWLEVTGFLFLVLAVIGGAATVREYHRYLAGTTTRGRIAVAAVFALLFLYFGVNSFWLSRKKGKKK
jgi:hypothetical protein